MQFCACNFFQSELPYMATISWTLRWEYAQSVHNILNFLAALQIITKKKIVGVQVYDINFREDIPKYKIILKKVNRFLNHQNNPPSLP